MCPFSAQRTAQFDALIHSIMKAGQAAGLAAAVTDRQGHILFAKYYGLRDAEKNLPIDGDTIFGVASITKSFTALSILQLAEKGLLHLEDPISRYIPEYADPDPGEPVRIWHLLCHSGGFYPQKRILMQDVARELGFDPARDGDYAFDPAIEDRGTRLVARRMTAQTDRIDLPGRAMSYFNDGFALLSHIIYQVSGERSFADYVKTHICAPLGMTRSSSEFLAPARDPNAAAIYVKGPEGRTTSDNLDNAFVLNGGGAMKSTLHDMTRYVAMYLGEGQFAGGSRVAAASSVREMIKPRQTNGYGSYYGFGLMVTPCGGYTLVRHGGSLPGVSSHMAWSYEKELGVVILCNTEGVAVSAAAEALMRLAVGEDPEICLPAYDDRPWDDALLTSACGRYASDEGAGFAIEAENGRPVVVEEGRRSPLMTIGSRYAVRRGPFGDVNFELLSDETRGVYAMRQGSRIVKKVQ